jgi:hypothetical protein
MKEYPILMNSPMVKAILDGSKTQTRRIIKPQPTGPFLGLLERPLRSSRGVPVLRAWFQNDPSPSQEITCPYGKPGDHLWVRETWSQNAGGEVLYRADYGPESYEGGAKGWKPSIHMPRRACRLVLEIVSVRVERLQDISMYDAMDEGVGKPRYAQFEQGSHLVGAFRDLWNEINGKRYPWSSNCWVWVIKFKRAE